MAKAQNLSLNPTKISGTCGRLMCCLKYEQEAYEDLIRTSPKVESFVDTPDGRGTVVELDLLRQRVKVRMEEHPEVISTFHNTDIAVLRNGKAKKNDPPIPADLAPISGGGKRKVKTEEDEPMLLDPIRFRYSTEAVVEEAEEPAPVEEEPAVEEAPKKRHRSRRSKLPPKNPPAQKKSAEPKEAKKAADAPQKANEPAAKPQKSKRRYTNYRRRKPKHTGGENQA